MAIDVSAPPLAADPPEGDPGEPVVPDRPAQPDTGPGRWLRLLVGIREDVLDWVPANRPHYTGFGIIVLNTGCLAAVAMFTALTKIVSSPPVALIPAALLWGWVILSIDRWLITSTHGVPHGRRFFVFAPRMVLAVLVALTIAEPLTLWIFQPALDRQVRATRAADLTSYESTLATCNPVSGALVTTAACAHYHLSLKDPPYAAEQLLARTKDQQAQVQGEVNTILQELSALRTKAQDECAGVSGLGLTGIPGVGWQCQRDWEAVTAFQSSSGLAAKRRLLQSLDTQVNSQTDAASSAQSTYTTELNTAIANAVAERKITQRGTIGLIDEWNALEELSSQSTFVTVGHWLIWLVLIALDCLPIMAKVISGATAYDRRLTRQLESDEQIHEVGLRLREQRETADKEVAIQLGELSKQERIRRIGEEERVGRAQREADILTRVQELAEKWILEDDQARPQNA